ncbi:MAG TPA: hypothetical protein VFL42_00935 [Terriglobales bacterium]|nr:hypothetical protein [Terriglobales bacterium]
MSKALVSVARFALTMVIVFTSLVAVPQIRGPQRPQDPPVFTCRADAGMECAYAIGDVRGTRIVMHMVLGSGQSRTLDPMIIGAQYCVAWGRPRVAKPVWPHCLAAPRGPNQDVGVVRPGRSNG